MLAFSYNELTGSIYGESSRVWVIPAAIPFTDGTSQINSVYVSLYDFISSEIALLVADSRLGRFGSSLKYTDSNSFSIRFQSSWLNLTLKIQNVMYETRFQIRI